MLTIAHIQMAMVNKTIWEMKRREHISYFRDVPLQINPFDKGVCGNLHEFLTMAEEKLEWDWPAAPSLEDLVDEKLTMGHALGMNSTLMRVQMSAAQLDGVVQAV
jgi:hypothetical protein